MQGVFTQPGSKGKTAASLELGMASVTFQGPENLAYVSNLRHNDTKQSELQPKLQLRERLPAVSLGGSRLSCQGQHIDIVPQNNTPISGFITEG